jgi:hypothetical protein
MLEQENVNLGLSKKKALKLQGHLQTAKVCFDMAERVLLVIPQVLNPSEAEDRLLEAARMFCRMGGDHVTEAYLLLPIEAFDIRI